MTPLLALHLLAVGIWIGCIAVETVVELPVLAVLFVSGFLLIDWSRLGGWLLVKILCGTGAIAANLGCAVIVFRRKRWADLRDSERVSAENRILSLLGLVMIPLGLAALAIGFYRIVAAS